MSSTLKCPRVLDLPTAEPYLWRLREVVDATGSERWTAHRLLATLAGGGSAGQDPEAGRYCVAGKASSVGPRWTAMDRGGVALDSRAGERYTIGS